jgi:ABC-type branched-subunit amino acid transport system substrate-binding protein
MGVKVMKSRFTAAIAASLFGAGLLASTAAMSGEIRVGVTLRMISENGEKQGEMIADEFAAVNAAGGINGNTIKLTLLNDECKSDKGVANANRLVYQEQVHLLIGSSCSSVTLPIVEVTAKGETPQIIPHSTSAAITQKNSEWVFRVPISSRFYKGVLAKYIDAIYIAGQAEAIARFLVQSYEVGIPDSVSRAGSSAVSNAPAAILAGDAVKGVFFSAAYSDSDTRQIAQDFNKMVRERYGISSVDHDFSQAWDLLQIVKLALGNADLKLTDDSLAADRTAIRDAIANIKNYEGLASGPISFCAAPTPQCRDGNRTPVLISYVKGGEDFEVEVLDRVTMPIDFGL